MEKMFTSGNDLQLFTQAICRTLFHSLWQGIILAMIVGTVMILFRRSASTTRYNALCGLLISFVITTIITFSFEFRVKDLHLQLNTSSIHKNVNSGSLNLFNIPGDVNFLQVIYQFLNKNAAQIVLLWLIVFLFKTIKMTTGLFYIRHLRKNYNSHIGGPWVQRLLNLSKKIGIEQAVLLVESQLVQVPLSEGILKPMILVPLGFLTSLPTNQVEAILLHELGHIKRKDSLVNLVQTAIECFLFFNPAVLWVSAMLRKERENCCDDLVLSVTNDRRDLVNALIAFQQNKLTFSKNIPALTGGENHMLARIKRIIFNYNKPLNRMEKFILTSSFVAFSLISASFFMPEPPSTKIAKPEIKHFVVTPEKSARIVEAPENINLTKPKKTISLKTAEETQDTLSQKSGKYLAEIEGAIDKNDLEKAFKLKYQLYLMLSNERGMVKRQKIKNELLEKSIQSQKEQMIQLVGTDSTGEKFANYRMKHSVLAIQKAVLTTNLQATESRDERLERLSGELQKESDVIWARRRDEIKSMQEQLINDFMAEGVIKSRENLSFRLHNMFLIINGVQQPEALHLKLKTKYLRETWMEWVYNWDGETGYRNTGIRYNG
jgi:bla regulator protein BlaR1